MARTDFSNGNEQKLIKVRDTLKAKTIRFTYGFDNLGKIKELTEQLFSIFDPFG